jgi:hypothetical protein
MINDKNKIKLYNALILNHKTFQVICIYHFVQLMAWKITIIV